GVLARPVHVRPAAGPHDDVPGEGAPRHAVGAHRGGRARRRGPLHRLRARDLGARDRPLHLGVLLKAPPSAHPDILHGDRVADPYRWLEDPNSDETRAWIDAQNRETFAFLEKLPARARIVHRLTELWNYERTGAPAREGDRWFTFKNAGLENQAVL